MGLRLVYLLSFQPVYVYQLAKLVLPLTLIKFSFPFSLAAAFSVLGVPPDVSMGYCFAFRLPSFLSHILISKVAPPRETYNQKRKPAFAIC